MEIPNETGVDVMSHHGEKSVSPEEFKRFERVLRSRGFIERSLREAIGPDEAACVARRRERLGDEARSIISSYDPDIVREFDSLPVYGTGGFPAIAGEILWGSHFFEGGLYEPNCEGIGLYHFPNLEEFDSQWQDISVDMRSILRICGFMHEASDAHRDGFVALLGRISAIDHVQHRERFDLPLLEDASPAGSLPYVDLVTGPSHHAIMNAIAARAEPVKRSVHLNDVSPFIESAFLEKRTLQRLDPGRIGFVAGDARCACGNFGPESLGTVRLCHPGYWLQGSDTRWIDRMAETLTPNGGKIIVSVRTPSWDRDEWTPPSLDAPAEEILEDLRTADASEVRVNGNLINSFHTRLVLRHPHQWRVVVGEEENGGIRPGGEAGEKITFLFTKRG